LAACVLDELAPPDRAEIQAHLDACGRCRARERALRESAEAIRGLPDLEAAPERRARAVEAMRRGTMDRLRQPRWQRILRGWLGRRRAVVALFAAASLLVIAASRFLPGRSAPMSLVAESVRGGVTIEPSPAAGARPLEPGTPLPAGCTVRVGGDAHAVFRASHGGRIECRSDTAFRWEPSPGSGDALMTFYYGGLWCDLRPLPRGRYVIRDVHDNRATVVGTRFEVVK
jgi:hypothetical protein